MPSRDLKHKPSMSNVLDEIIQMGVLVRRPREILGYLAAYPDTGGVLASLSRIARSQWPDDAQLSLELYRDPEVSDVYPTLYVRQERYSPDILDRIDAANVQFEPFLRDYSGWVLLTTDFQPPR